MNKKIRSILKLSLSVAKGMIEKQVEKKISDKTKNDIKQRYKIVEESFNQN